MTASAPLAAFLASIRLPVASPLQEAGIEKRVSGKSAAQTASPPVLPALAFPAVLGSLVETSEPVTTLKDDAGPGEANPATAGRPFFGAAARGCVRNSQLCQGEPLAAAVPTAPAVATATVTLPVAATRPEDPAVATSTAPETTAKDLACVAPQERLWSQPARLSPAPALPDSLSTTPSSQAAAPDGSSATWSKVTAPEAPYRPANRSYMWSGKATADSTPGEEDAPSLLDPAAALAERSTVPEPLPATLPSQNPGNRPSGGEWPASAGGSGGPPPAEERSSAGLPVPDGDAARNRLNPAAGPELGLAARPAPETPPAGLPSNPSSPLPDSPQPATVPAPQEFSLASPFSEVPASSSQGLPVPRPREPFAGLSAQPGPTSKRPLDRALPALAAALPDGTPSTAVQAAVPNGPAEITARSRTAIGAEPPSPNVPPLSAETPSSAAPASLGQPALEQRLFAATANRTLFLATTVESTRHSAAMVIQSPLSTGALEPARYGTRPLWEPAAQSGGGKAAALAFGARLVPTAGPKEAPAGDRPDPLPVAVTAPARRSAAAPLDGAVPEPASEAAATPLDPVIGQTGDTAEESSSLPAPLEKGEAAAPERFRRSETPAPSSWEPSSASAARLSPDTVYAPAVRLANASNQPEHPAAAEPRPVAAPEPHAGAESSKPPATARNIQLDVNAGDRRVEVRLTERGGEVQVAVRTPDAHLASALREDLPALSSRLAESGFRAETWHPASPGASSGVPSGPGEWHKLAEPAPGSPLQDPNGRSRQNGGQPHGDSQPRQPQTREQQPNRKDQRKDFAWLMSSLR